MSVLTTPISMSQGLVRFLLARLDEDTADVKRLAHAGRESGVRSLDWLRRDVNAKRKVIGTLQQLLVLRDQPLEKPVRDSALHMLRLMAVPYDQHADYRSEWRPSAPH